MVPKWGGKGGKRWLEGEETIKGGDGGGNKSPPIVPAQGHPTMVPP